MDPNRNDPASPSIRDTAKGIAVRAGVLSVVGIIAATWLFSLAAKAAGGLVKIIAAVVLLAIGGGYVTWKAKKFKRDFSSRRSQPEL